MFNNRHKPSHPAIERLYNPLLKNAIKHLIIMVNKLIAAGYNISWEQVMKFAEGGTGFISSILSMR
ncbi:hypothetical protein ELQ35_11135 [Peribacillus cavernae]|uniref:Uncharacterized protein n=1 Tax=Peribacillus cavernae TaxID=1674310 RepID=A0A3S0TVH8_9BACI|nr:hypothetical protein [Peribacillus cavernae]MDQ0220172.1 hypothetical protein [Peribacillus cavernae]RUQ28799.1 hypothetical protein ELQ35_11135 [Peribacillus cavernae]